MHGIFCPHCHASVELPPRFQPSRPHFALVELRPPFAPDREANVVQLEMRAWLPPDADRAAFQLAMDAFFRRMVEDSLRATLVEARG